MTLMPDTPTILFAGGGTGGHIFPNLAVWERLAERGAPCRAHFALSNRSLDTDIIGKSELPFAQLVVRPWSSRPWHWPAFLLALSKAKKQVARLIEERNIKAVVATGGYVSGPAIMAAAARGLPIALVNLDAVPGKANRRLAASAPKTFTVYDSPLLPGAARIGLPLRRSAVGLCDVRDARARLDLDPDRPTLMITGGSQGALSVNEAVVQLARHPQVQQVLEGWQILHITGPGAPSRKGGANGERIADAKSAYDALGIPSRVMPFCDAMGDAWRAATVAISRSGAGAVAEAWTNATPTIFLPYPFHKDDHQRLNAEPLAADGGCILLRDLKDAGANASQMVGPFMQLACDDAKRKVMIETLRESEPADGADAVAHWVAQQVGV